MIRVSLRTNGQLKILIENHTWKKLNSEYKLGLILLWLDVQ